MLSEFTLAILIGLYILVKVKPEYTPVASLPKLSKVDFIVLGLGFLFFATLNGSYLFMSLAGDELYHFQTANTRDFNKALRHMDRLPFLQELPFSYLLNLENIFDLFVFLALGVLFKVWKQARLLIFCLWVFNFRSLIWESYEPHPPLRLLPVWFASSLFGIHDFSGRLPQFLVIVASFFIIYKYLNTKIRRHQAILAALAACTLPIFMHAGTLVEFSIWTAFGLLAVLMIFSKCFEALVLDDNAQVSPKAFLHSSWIIGFLTLIRPSTFVLSIPIAIYFAYFWTSFKFKDRSWRLWLNLAPLLVMIPFIMKSILQGTPATYLPDEILPFLPTRLSAPERIWFAFKSGVVSSVSIRQMGILTCLIAIFSLIPFSRKQISHKVFRFSMFFILLLSFYVVRPVLWGVARYQIEFWWPFYALGIIQFLTIKKWTPGDSKMISFVLFGVILFNIYEYRLFPQEDFTVDSSSPVFQYPHILSKETYDWNAALTDAKNEGYQDSVFTWGNVYGVYPLILNSYSGKAIKAADIRYAIYQSTPDVNLLDDDPNIQLVLYASPILPKEDLLGPNWKVWKTFQSDIGNNPIRGFIRYR